MTRRRWWAVLLGAALVTQLAAAPAQAAPAAQTGSVRVFAGGGQPAQGEGDDGPAPAARLGYPTGIAHDAAGTVFIGTETHGNSGIRRVSATTGVISTVRARRTPDGPLWKGVFDPGAVAVGADGTVFALDYTQPRRIQAITPGGLVTTVEMDGAGYGEPEGIAIGPTGDLYVAMGRRILRRGPDGVFRVVAGGRNVSPFYQYGGDGGPATDAQLSDARDVTVGTDGTVAFRDDAYYFDSNGYAGPNTFGVSHIRRISQDGIISTIAGGGLVGPICDGTPATSVDVGYGDVALDTQGRVLFTVNGEHRVFRVEPDGTISTILGNGTKGAATPGPATASPLQYASALDVLADGTLLVGEPWQGRVLAIAPGDAPGVASVVAGTGERGAWGDGGAAACRAELAYPTSVARAPDGSTYVADYLNNRIRRIDPHGVITTVAGTGVRGHGGDGGQGTYATLHLPRAVAVDGAGRVLIADTGNNRIRRLDPRTGVITTVAGTGRWGFGGDGGPGAAAMLASPYGVTVGADGTVWVADTGNHRLRRMDTVGVISTATADLTAPRALTTDATGVYVADPGSSSVRHLDATGVLTTVIGPDRGRAVNNPAGLLATPQGLYVAEAGADRVLLVGNAGHADVVAGGGTGTLPGVATDAALSQPQGITAGPRGTVLIADTGHHRLVRLTR